MSQRLGTNFFARDPAQVAPELLGKTLQRQLGSETLSGTITETEAYYGKEDPASRVAQQGKTRTTEIMWDAPGTIFVYMVHGYWLLNIITKQQGEPGAVLIRALKPVNGVERMKANRDLKDKQRLTDGPGKLTQALAIDKSFNGLSITNSQLAIKDANNKASYKRTGRIGVSDGQDLQLRFIAQDSTKD